MSCVRAKGLPGGDALKISSPPISLFPFAATVLPFPLPQILVSNFSWLYRYIGMNKIRSHSIKLLDFNLLLCLETDLFSTFSSGLQSWQIRMKAFEVYVELVHESTKEIVGERLDYVEINTSPR